MKAVFYALALLATGGAAFVSYQNLENFKVQNEAKLQAIDQNKAKKSQIDTEQKKLDGVKANLVTATEKRDAVKQNIDSLAAKGKALTRELAEQEALLETQKGKFADLKKVEDKLKEILGKLGGDVTIDNLPATVNSVTEDRNAKEKQLKELEGLVEAAQKNIEKNQAEIGRLADRDASRNSRMRHNAMESVITAVNDDWGFVIIGAGSNTGFTPQTKLLVKRDGKLIGEIKPSSIEPSQTIAEIDPDSIAPGARIQPGDRVILAEPATN